MGIYNAYQRLDNLKEISTVKAVNQTKISFYILSSSNSHGRGGGRCRFLSVTCAQRRSRGNCGSTRS